ncbi:MAG: ORF6N domain-containing protein [Bacteroidales bacterium]|nr:ORF6N domain-containing protein [Bacteroidales bacterium]
MTAIIRLEDVENKIIEIRKQKVLLDSDVAELYGVETKRVNEAVSNNPDKFPEGYIIDLTNNEWNILKSKFSTSIKGGKTKLPKAFTERGLYMLATIMKSNKATQTTLTIIETFARIKQLSRNIKQLSEIQDDKNKKNLMQKSGEIIAEILGDDLALNETETTIEINFAVLKFKHTVKKKKDN